ncbi:MAG: hypothetical protein Q4G35_02340 [Propionibacteriaceae bacterium]|nr:hypothetical protein [Propionibacteriaceae bacterium]
MRQRASRRRRFTVVTLGVLIAGVGIGCTQPVEQPIGFGPSDVVKMEVYLYPYGASGDAAAQYLEVEDKRDIAQWVRFFDYLPIVAAEFAENTLVGQEVVGLRFHLHEGDSFEISQVFIGGESVLIVQADESRWVSRYGSPLASLPDALSVDVSEAPRIGTP